MLFDLVCCQCALTNLGDVQVQAGGGEQRGGGGAGEERGGRGADHRARGEEVHRDQAGEVALVDGGPPHCAGAAHLITYAANRLISEAVQSRRRPLLGPSPG